MAKKKTKAAAAPVEKQLSKADAAAEAAAAEPLEESEVVLVDDPVADVKAAWAAFDQKMRDKSLINQAGPRFYQELARAVEAL